MKTDYLIIGQGIAGSCLAYELIKADKKVLVIDNHHRNSSSKIAAGIFNPLVFKRLTKSWLADELRPFLNEFYPELEAFLGVKFYHKKEILRVFSSVEEQNNWSAKSEAMPQFLSDEILVDVDGRISAPFGAGKVKNSGHVEVCKLLDAFRRWLTKNDLLLEEKFEFNELKTDKTKVEYKGIAAEKIIFCEGHQATENPVFDWLPFVPAKGEMLIIKAELPTDYIINSGCFVLPLGNKLFLIGSTYEWADLTPKPTKKGKNELLEKLGKTVSVHFEVIDHVSGIRPAMKDRRPLIGMHPKFKNIGIFNGLGTKGIMLAPYFARQFCGFLQGRNEMNKQVTIERFLKA